MRHIGGVLALVAAVSLAALAAPKIVVDQPVYDFGEVKEGAIVKHAFVIRNGGDAPLVFTHRPTTSCGCTVAALPKEALMPGESMELLVTFDSSGFGGRHVRKEIYVFTNDPENPRTVLTLTGYVRPAEPHERSPWYLKYQIYVLVDVRSPDEFARAHLLGATNIPFDQLADKIEVFPRSALIFLYDTDGQTAAQAAAMLVGKGYRFARALDGGLVAWQKEYGNLFIAFGEGGPVAFTGTPQGGSYSVSPQQLLSRYILIIDVRPPEEFAAGHFVGAVNVDPGTLPKWIAAHIPRSLPRGANLNIWCVDDDGTRSCPAAKYVRSQGYNAFCLLGGIAQWKTRYGEAFIVSSEQ